VIARKPFPASLLAAWEATTGIKNPSPINASEVGVARFMASKDNDQGVNHAGDPHQQCQNQIDEKGLSDAFLKRNGYWRQQERDDYQQELVRGRGSCVCHMALIRRFRALAVGGCLFQR
jgi:hypothetical protein